MEGSERDSKDYDDHDGYNLWKKEAHDEGSTCRIRDGTRFSQWLDDTTAHGIVHVFKAPTLPRRILWGVVFSIACMLLAAAVVERVYFYFTRTTATTISLETDLRAIPFPSVTVCNLNPIRLSYAQQNNLTELFTFLYEPFEENSSRCPNLLGKVDSQHAHKPIRDILYEGRNMLDDFVKHCYFIGSHRLFFDCKQNLSLTLTSYGYCYSFNIDTTAEELTVSNSGARYGLSLILDIQQEEYLPVFGSAGVTVSVQPRGNPPNPAERGIFLPPGEEGAIELRAQIFNDTSTVSQYYPKACRDVNDPDAELSFFRGYNYSLSACRLQQEYQVVADICSCLDVVFDKDAVTDQTLSYCTLSRVCCVYNSYFFVNDAKCIEACKRKDFVSHISYSAFPSNSSTTLLSEFFNVSSERIVDNVVSVNIFFGDPHTRVLITKDAFSFTSLLSNIGGELGLFMGASIITAIAFGWFTLDELLEFVKKTRWCE